MLVLSLFPGADFLGIAFELEGFCVVSGPDVIFGRDVRRFHPPAGRFDGIIGGPPCKGESKLSALNGTPGSLRHEFCRVVYEADPDWWLMEAVKVWDDLMHRESCYASQELDRERGNAVTCICERRHGPVNVLVLNNRWLGEVQHRKRFFHTNLVLVPEMAALEHHDWKYAVLAGHGGGVGTVYRGMAKYSLEDACELQGLPRTWHESLPFKRDMKYEVIGNGVPLPMGKAVARAVKKALEGR